ncbi:hypothetical protein H6P81_002676 [Aristolochia fimbriata]|uniref:DUF4218 domain-containing protein n=1 Tax=Aristolochia fimbriata TaxID=158543 RepID=A0AAV7FAN5_ARIFI|nr:hypothetical protein H6P81_002676 [Aristolochia fimbriata]
MTWHYTVGTTEDGKMCHPRDSIAWKHFDAQHSAFSSDPRSVRLGLASDGFSPFKICSGSSHSRWPVVLIVYNLPPWLAMKQSLFIMSLLIDGPKSPGNDIDVYLQPLIDELQMLWGGVRTFDAEKGEYFQMRAAVMWTINDFPAYGMLSGWSTKGYTACPTCHIFHGSIYLPCSRKCVYLRHRRFLPDNHPWRVDKKSYNGEVENDQATHALTGEQIIQQWNGYENVRFGKAPKVGVHALRDGNTLLPSGWKKKSIFFDLPYWGTLLLRHNFDVMHVEKNVCESIINTILQKDGKSKDNIKARMDLERLNIQNPYTQSRQRKRTGEFVIPHASYQMSKSEKELFLKVLKDFKLPDGFSSNISKNVRVREGKLVGLKSHDCHVLMQQLLPLALRTTVAKPVATVLIEYCHFFKELCSKTVELNRLKALEQKIPIILCNLEKIFPPAFFDVMVHLTIHLATEVKVAGPVQYRWMYPIERYLLTLKNYIRNKHRPEGSIAEGYLMEEVTTFCARYVDGMETKLNRPVRYEEGPIGAGTSFLMTANESYQAHRFILFNNDNVMPYIDEHKTALKRQHPQWSESRLQLEQHNVFVQWFREHVNRLRERKRLTNEIISLSRGPQHCAMSYSGYFVKGNKFDIKLIDNSRATQNSGVAAIGEEDEIFYGLLESVQAITYGCEDPIYLFKCHLYNTNVPQISLTTFFKPR